MIKSFTRLKPLNLLVVRIALIILPIALLVQSCKKQDEVVSNVALLSVVNTFPTLATFNLYLDDAKVNTAALPFGGVINYFEIVPKTYSAKLTIESSTASLFTKDIVLENQKIYSLFFINGTASPDYLLVEDDINGQLTEKAYIRFMNLSPDASALNLVEGTNIVIPNKTYKSTDAFIEIEPKTYIFEIKDRATSVTKATLKSMEIVKGKCYTIISRGYLTPGDIDQAFSGQVIINR
ncbi:DUF4397 domain-containing protein [Pedobacter metabolipauper]|uniref:Uncharacterized protein DUF4397 n=1 Tax=Pedobacter metabolipauper TaxID=425513 RepID=A0A4R6T017_9SPHI|nr:DUF4397 domain-containing protein [Pedobacter metabolipauper]TDQ11349.1 uncharacterized protein DUF4397 [Pedobacter metabolipauper]